MQLANELPDGMPGFTNQQAQGYFEAISDVNQIHYI